MRLLDRASLRLKMVHLADANFAAEFATPEIPASALREPLRDQSVAELASRILDLHPIQVLLRNDGLIPQAAFFDPQAVATAGPPVGARQLQGVLGLLDAAIAFQNLLSGDLIVAQMASQIDDPKATAALQRNSVLAMNVAREILYNRADALCSGPDPSTPAPGCATLPDRYQHAVNASDPSELAQMFDQAAGKVPLEFAGGAGEYRIKIGGLLVPLPTKEEFRQRTYVATPALEALWRLREAVIDALTGYSLRSGIPGSAIRPLPPAEQTALSLLLAIQ
jgi:hypothetical protein